MATIDVKDAAGATVALEKPLVPGRTAAATSRPVVLSNEDLAALQALGSQTTLAAILAKIIAAPASEATLALIQAIVTAIYDATAVGIGVRIKDGTGAGVLYPSTSLDDTNDRLGGLDVGPIIDPSAADAPLTSLVKGLLTFAVGIAHDAADSQNPTKIGGKARAALSALTLVANSDRVDGAFDLDGALIVRPGGTIGDRISNSVSNTDGAQTACIAAQAAGIKVNLTDVTLANTSASDIIVEIKDGATTKWVFPAPAHGGVTHRFETPLTGTAATAWNFDPSAATTTVYCSMSGRLSKV